MSRQERDHQFIFSYLKSLNFHYLNDWVIQCFNYCKSSDPNLSLESIKEIVKEQWLLVNLRNFKVPVLPPNLIASHKTILPGKYMVQVETLIDCSKSCFSQFQEIQKAYLDNVESGIEKKEWDKKSSRCLVFTISDGVQELKAMEYEPIKQLRTNDPKLLPGFKMLIIGPVECRKGMILLKEENVLIHGGEVDTMTVTNSLRSVLMRKLNLNEEDYPQVTESLREGEIQINSSDVETTQNPLETRLESETIEPSSSVVNEKEHLEKLLSQNDDLFLTVPLEFELLAQESLLTKSNTLKTCKKDNISNCSSSCDNPVLENFNLNDLNFDNVFSDNSVTTVLKKHDLPPEEKITPNPKKHCEPEKITETQTAPNIWFNYPSQKTSVKTNEGASNSGKNSFKNNNSNLKKINTKNTCISNQDGTKSFQTTISTFFKSSYSTESQQLPTLKSISTKPITISSKPFIYLKQVVVNDLQKPCTYIIKANILSLKKKITIKNNEYNLVGTITDGSLSTDVRFSSNIIDSFLGYSPCEMQEMMKIKEVNSAVEDKIKEAFKKAQEKFISLNCLMSITFFPSSDLPLVLSLQEISMEHLEALKNRMFASFS